MWSVIGHVATAKENVLPSQVACLLSKFSCVFLSNSNTASRIIPEWAMVKDTAPYWTVKSRMHAKLVFSRQHCLVLLEFHQSWQWWRTYSTYCVLYLSSGVHAWRKTLMRKLRFLVDSFYGGKSGFDQVVNGSAGFYPITELETTAGHSHFPRNFP